MPAPWGEGVDGYDLGVISVALPFIVVALGASPVEAGLIGASSLIGILLRGPARRAPHRPVRPHAALHHDLALFVVLGALQAFVTEPWQLFVVRVALGMAIGAEYAIGAAMLAEFAPAANRGRRLSALLVSWYGGYLVAVVVAYLMVGAFDISWRWVLATSAVPAIVTMLLRRGFSESPRWLVNQDRPEEAHAVVRHRLGAVYYELEEMGAELQNAGGLKPLLTGDNRRRMIFICVFWACNVAPYFAIFTFAPTVLASLRLENEAAGTITVNAIAAVGALSAC